MCESNGKGFISWIGHVSIWNVQATLRRCGPPWLIETDIRRIEKMNNDKGDKWGIVESGVLDGSVMERYEDRLYGFIVSGPIERTLKDFKCLYGSFVQRDRRKDSRK